MKHIINLELESLMGNQYYLNIGFIVYIIQFNIHLDLKTNSVRLPFTVVNHFDCEYLTQCSKYLLNY